MPERPRSNRGAPEPRRRRNDGGLEPRRLPSPAPLDRRPRQGLGPEDPHARRQRRGDHGGGCNNRHPSRSSHMGRPSRTPRTTHNRTNTSQDHASRRHTNNSLRHRRKSTGPFRSAASASTHKTLLPPDRPRRPRRRSPGAEGRARATWRRAKAGGSLLPFLRRRPSAGGRSCARSAECHAPH